MANRSIEDLENQGNASVGLVGLLLGGLAAAAISHGCKQNKRANLQDKRAELDNKISNLDRQINDLSSGLFGGVLNSSEIDRLKKERSQLIAERNKLV